jgi:thiol:disulfide interchange protein DsbC
VRFEINLCLRNIMHKTISTFVCLALACAAFGAGASEATVKAALMKKYPEIPVESVTKTPVAGIYEAFANGQLIYTDENATYLFVNANLIDTEKKANLTEERMGKLTAIRFDQLPLNLAVKKVKGKGTRKLAYFADPNCGYCKKFEQDLTKINDVTIYVFLYPVLGPDSLEKAKSIWCSKDKIKAWDDQLVNNIAPTAAGTCDTSSIDKTLAFGKQKNITGTPTMFFVDGQRVPGAIPGEMIEQRLAAAK